MNPRVYSNPYATVDDFGRVFADDMSALYRLSHVLTADHQKAEQCFTAALEESIRSNGVFKEWARSWAKRTVVKNAIAQLKPHPNIASLSTLPVRPYPRQPHNRFSGLKAVLALPPFERFVFVMSVLEKYSVHDSALLLGSSSREIREARTRALENIANGPGMLPIEVNSEKRRQIAR